MPGRINNQEFYRLDPVPSESIMMRLSDYFKEFTRSERVAFNYLVRLFSRKGKVYVSQATWASACGVCVRQLYRWIEKWHAAGLIYSNYRHMMTNQYKVSSYLLSTQNRALLRSIIFSFGIFPVSMISSIQSNEIENVRQPKINIFIYTHNQQQTTTQTTTQRQVSKRRTCARTYMRENYHTQESNAVIQEYISNLVIPGLTLTIEDKVALSRYTEKVLVAAVAAFNKKRVQGVSFKAPVSYLLGCCRKIAESSDNNHEESVVRTPYHQAHKPKSVRDPEEWKRGGEQMAHWDMVALGEQMANYTQWTKGNASYVVDWCKEQLRVALAEHQESTCHLCTTFGIAHKIQPWFYRGSNSGPNSSPFMEPTHAAVVSPSVQHPAPIDVPPPPPRNSPPIATTPPQTPTIMARLLAGNHTSPPIAQTNTTFQLEENNWPVEYVCMPEDEIF